VVSDMVDCHQECGLLVQRRRLLADVPRNTHSRKGRIRCQVMCNRRAGGVCCPSHAWPPEIKDSYLAPAA